MKEIKIQDLVPGLVSGVDVALPDSSAHRETYFEWKAASLTAPFGTNQVTGGMLKCWHHAPVFREAENHTDAEMFCFLRGTALMLFIDYINDQPDVNTAQVVRIKPGTRLIIDKCKGHFVPVAESDEPLLVVVVAPPMDAPRVALTETISGVIG
ncbi:MAG: hypothetical protein WCK47_04690 [bacterium]